MNRFSKKIKKGKKIKKRESYGGSLWYAKNFLKNPIKTKEEKAKKLKYIEKYRNINLGLIWFIKRK